MTTAEELNKQRGSVYGPFMSNAIVAQAIKEALRHPCAKTLELPDDVREGLDLIALKMSRIVTGDPEYLDNWDDIQGYARVVSERIRAQRQSAGSPGAIQSESPGAADFQGGNEKERLIPRQV